jgi:signal peptidase I
MTATTHPAPPATAAPALPPSWRATGAALAVSCLARAVLGTLALLLLVSVAPVLLGWQTTVVLSGSMEPGVQPGDVAVVRPVDPARLHVGDVLLVDDPDLPGRLRLHRLAAVEDGGLRLKGDANPTADPTLVAPSAVHGVGVLRLPDLGLPVLWLDEGRYAAVAGAVAGLAGLLALALLHRGAPADGDDVPPPDRRRDRAPGRRSARRPLRRLRGPAARRGAVAAVATGVLLSFPGAYAVFNATTANDADTFAAATYFSCAAAASGESAAQYLPLQETSGTTAVNRGTFSGNGTYAGGVTYAVSGPACHGGASRAVTLDGSSGYVWTPISVSSPSPFSTQLWFKTGTSTGGYLVGFGNGTNGDTSSAKDRLVYMTDAGKLVFGVYDGAPHAITSSASYNDNTWHLVTATFSGRSGARLYVDGALVAANSAYTAAETDTGFFRAGYDSLSGWPSAPSSWYFAGSIAHLGIFTTALSATEVADQYAAAN